MICPVPRAREYFVAENVTLGLDSRYVVSRGLELQIGTEKDKLRRWKIAPPARSCPPAPGLARPGGRGSTVR